jgi:flagellar biosynthesis/type III secretory pathway protein FliH
MSVVTRGRVVRGESGAQTRTAAMPRRRGPRVCREELEARACAAEIVREAERAAAGVAERAARDAREAETAKLAAQFLALRAAEEARAERDLDRAIELAVVLAERIVGSAVERDPALLVPLARQALAEARGARKRRIEAHPADAAALAAQLGDLGGDIVIEPNEELSRGSLVVHTDLGKLDARLTPQLQRLAVALREALGGPR